MLEALPLLKGLFLSVRRIFYHILAVFVNCIKPQLLTLRYLFYLLKACVKVVIPAMP